MSKDDDRWAGRRMQWLRNLAALTHESEFPWMILLGRILVV